MAIFVVEYITRNSIVATVIGPTKRRIAPTNPVAPANSGIAEEAIKFPAI